MATTQSNFKSELVKAFKNNSLSSLINNDRATAFEKLTFFMLEENEKYNLTAITDLDKIILNHYLDCAALAARLPKDAKICDIGCGAGFPTLPIAILRPDVKITAIDSTAKRVNYVKCAADMLGLTNVECVVMRAEDGGNNELYREKYDVATARAVAALPILAELCVPYVRCGGQFIAMKGKNAEYEIKDARRALSILGITDLKCEEITLTGSEETLTHPLVIMKKGAKTPKNYPRPYAQISKKPL